MSFRLWQMVVDLGGIWNGLELLPNIGQDAGDQVGCALVSHAEHHGGAHIESVAFPVKMTSTASWNDIPV